MVWMDPVLRLTWTENDPPGIRAGLDWTGAQISDSSVEKGRKSTPRKFKLSNKMFILKKGRSSLVFIFALCPELMYKIIMLL